MSSKDPWESDDLCGRELVSGGVFEDLAEEYDPVTWYEAENGNHYCNRDVWVGANDRRCIWHADVTDKPHDDLITSLSGEQARLDRAVLDGVKFPEGSSFANYRLRDAHLRGVVLPYADLSGANLVDADLGGAQLKGTDLTNAKLLDANLVEADLGSANLAGANLTAVDFSDAWIPSGNFSEADLGGADFNGAKLLNANFVRSELLDADLSSADLGNTEFYGANLHNANLRNADISGADLNDAVLFQANLGSANLFKANFKDSDLRDSRMSDTDLQGAHLTNANLERANLTRANLFDADLTGAKLYGAVLSDVQLNTNTEFGDHYTDDSDDPDKAAWTLRQLERLFRENALPEKAREAYLARKDRRRQQYWDETVTALRADVPLTDRIRTTTKRARQWFRTALYGATMRYGESPRRVITLSGLTVLAFGVVYPFFGGMDAGNETTTNYGFEPVVAGVDGLPAPVVDVLANLYFSAVTFTTLGYGDIQPATPVVELLATVESFLGALLMALLVFVLGRRATR